MQVLAGKNKRLGGEHVLLAVCHIAGETVLADLEAVQGLGLAVADMPVFGVDVVGLSAGIY